MKYLFEGSSTKGHYCKQCLAIKGRGRCVQGRNQTRHELRSNQRDEWRNEFENHINPILGFNLEEFPNINFSNQSDSSNQMAELIWSMMLKMTQ